MLIPRRLIISACLVFSVVMLQAQTLSEKVAETVMTIWNDTLHKDPAGKWAYEQGVVLEGMENVWYRTANGRYFDYIQRCMDHFVRDDGTIRGYKPEDHNIDNIKNGRSLLLLYKVSGKQKYLKAVKLLREQLRSQPRTSDGGFWHKRIYPNQMWLDGLYMGEPFYAEYAALMHEDTAFNDIARQFILMEKHARNTKNGLLYHGWDDSRLQPWADKKTGVSPNFWARAMGWYGMALVDVLEYFPNDHSRRGDLLAILKRLADAIVSTQEKSSGLWYQLLDKPTLAGNYHESSAACMFVYTLAKGTRLGYLPAKYLPAARKGYEGIRKEFIETTSNGQTNLKDTVAVAGLGGSPYRDGSVAYYLREKVVTNDGKGVGAFLLASNEMDIAAIRKTGAGKTVVLDSYFNNETFPSPTGFTEPFHYKWEEKDNNGLYFLSRAFGDRGAILKTLKTAPDETSLKGASIYLVIDPDSQKETPNPNYVDAKHVKALDAWVKAGGVLVLMGNDSGNMEFEHFNKLAENFGIHFNEDSKNKVTGSQFEMGKIDVPAGNPLFKTEKKLYMKELSSLSLKAPAVPLLQDKGYVVIAQAKVGLGKVIAVGDPWLYDEYTDGRKLPKDFDNYKAAEDLVEWVFSM